MEIELNPGYVFDDTTGGGWSVWWSHRTEDGELLTVSGSEKAHAGEKNPLLLFLVQRGRQHVAAPNVMDIWSLRKWISTP